MKPSALLIMYPNAVDDVYGDAALAHIAERTRLLSPPLSAEAALANPALLSQTEVIFSSWGAPLMDEAFLNLAPKLRAVFYAAGTIKAWATEAFWARGLTVSTAATANALPVADYTLATLLFSLKNGWRYALGAKALGQYPERVECAGAFRSRVGLVSFGQIARLVASRLRAHDIEVVVHDPFLSEEAAAQAQVARASLDELFQSCDAISLHAPLLAETRQMIGREHFERMRPRATFINTARGELVREPELIDVFTRRPDLTAVLDVTFPEPPAPGSALFTLPNVVLTPHIAGSMGRECRRMGQAMLDEFARWVSGAPLQWQVTADQARRMA